MATSNKTFRAAIFGTGNIGTDILIKLQRSPHVQCVLFVGRNTESKGIKIAKTLQVETSIDGFAGLLSHADEYDLVFDATSAIVHKQNYAAMQKMNKHVIDLTPSRTGKICVPALNMQELVTENNINMITCGGQAAAPLAHALGKVHPNIEYIEVVSSIAAKSAGPATRTNIDEYLDTTEVAIKKFSGCQIAKAILNINPATPSVDMKTTIFATITNPNMDAIKREVDNMVTVIQQYVPGYELLVEPWFDGKQVMVMVRVRGQGDYLPAYAGNLDIITCAAVRASEAIAEYELS
jgi:acetaldehyde dehydrogenase